MLVIISPDRKDLPFFIVCWSMWYVTCSTLLWFFSVSFSSVIASSPPSLSLSSPLSPPQKIPAPMYSFQQFVILVVDWILSPCVVFKKQNCETITDNLLFCLLCCKKMYIKWQCRKIWDSVHRICKCVGQSEARVGRVL